MVHQRKILSSLFAILLLLCIPLTASPIDLPNGPRIHLDRELVELPVEVVNQKGELEFIVFKGMEKDYESIFTTTVKGSMLHLALKTVGLKNSDFPMDENVKFQERVNIQRSKGTRVRLDFLADGTQKEIPLNHYLTWGDDTPIEATEWFFAGSYFFYHNEVPEDSKPKEPKVEEVQLDDEETPAPVQTVEPKTPPVPVKRKRIYAADSTRNIIGAYPKLSMVLGPAQNVGKPHMDGKSNNTQIKINTKTIPPKGTKGVILIRPVPKKK